MGTLLARSRQTTTLRGKVAEWLADAHSPVSNASYKNRSGRTQSRVEARRLGGRVYKVRALYSEGWPVV